MDPVSSMHIHFDLAEVFIQNTSSATLIFDSCGQNLSIIPWWLNMLTSFIWCPSDSAVWNISFYAIKRWQVTSNALKQKKTQKSH